ncbi:hypothetical protein ILYODFUR_034754 [Ilyodon furcidens]|uniref:Ig-like domain-containing protein n=1 Tax=Ilyodon furcidens TaxID=33524 RepID=A0ABV0UXT4_9TELE
MNQMESSEFQREVCIVAEEEGEIQFSTLKTVEKSPFGKLIYKGETVTLRCEIQGGGGTQWTYEWRPAWLNYYPTSSEYRITRAESGRYSCRRTRNYLLTQWSDNLYLTVCK